MEFDEEINLTDDNRTKEEKFRNSFKSDKNKQRPAYFADAKEFIPSVKSSDYRLNNPTIEAAREHAGNIEDMMR